MLPALSRCDYQTKLACQSVVNVGDLDRELAYIIQHNIVGGSVRVRQIFLGFVIDGDTEWLVPAYLAGATIESPMVSWWRGILRQ